MRGSEVPPWGTTVFSGGQFFGGPGFAALAAPAAAEGSDEGGFAGGEASAPDADGTGDALQS